MNERNALYRDNAYLWTIERNHEQHRQLQSALAQDSRAMLRHHNCSIGDARITAPIPTVQLSKAELARVKEILHRAEPCTSPYRPNVVPDSYEHYSLDNQGEVIATGSFPASDLTYKVPPTFLLTFYSRDRKVHLYNLHLCRIWANPKLQPRNTLWMNSSFPIPISRPSLPCPPSVGSYPTCPMNGRLASAPGNKIYRSTGLQSRPPLTH